MERTGLSMLVVLMLVFPWVGTSETRATKNRRLNQERRLVRAESFFVRLGFLPSAHRMSFLIQATVGFSPILVWQHWLLPQCVLDVPEIEHILGRTTTTSCVIKARRLGIPSFTGIVAMAPWHNGITFTE
jgi:hypothetical protein